MVRVRMMLLRAVVVGLDCVALLHHHHCFVLGLQQLPSHTEREERVSGDVSAGSSGQGWRLYL